MVTPNEDAENANDAAQALIKANYPDSVWQYYALVDVLSRRGLRSRLVRPSTAGSAVTAFVFLVVLVTVPAVLAAGHHHP